MRRVARTLEVVKVATSRLPARHRSRSGEAGGKAAPTGESLSSFFYFLPPALCPLISDLRPLTSVLCPLSPSRPTSRLARLALLHALCPMLYAFPNLPPLLFTAYRLISTVLRS